jgi:crotonobetainyl-CoA:carnitine CoA-transferase CaiB-like acyl-CoA transferase
MLGDMGADVIRVEGPAGDVVREYEPMRNPLMGAFHLNMNRNKRSVWIDLKTESGREAMEDLISGCDVFVTNMRKAALDRLGLDETSVRALRPDIVYCLANGFGSAGPRAHHSAYDDVIQASSGLASMFQWFEAEPRLIPSVIADKVTGLHVAFAIAAALVERERTGSGASIEVPMAETMAAFNLVEHLGGKTFEPRHGHFSYSRLRTPARRPRRTSDGWAVIMPYSEANWHDFFDFVDRPELKSDPRFGTASGRVEHADELYRMIDEVVPRHSTSQWLEFCDEHSIPAAEVVDLEHIDEDAHFAAVGLIRDSVHPTEGPIHYVRDPIVLDGEPTSLRRHAPTLGEHTAEVLAEIGWDQARIDAHLDGLNAALERG